MWDQEWNPAYLICKAHTVHMVSLSSFTSQSRWAGIILDGWDPPHSLPTPLSWCSSCWLQGGHDRAGRAGGWCSTLSSYTVLQYFPYTVGPGDLLCECQKLCTNQPCYWKIWAGQREYHINNEERVRKRAWLLLTTGVFHIGREGLNCLSCLQMVI